MVDEVHDLDIDEEVQTVVQALFDKLQFCADCWEEFGNAVDHSDNWGGTTDDPT